LQALERILTEQDLTLEETAFMGDDLVDLPVMSAVGLSIAVADASEYLFEAAHYVTASPGGRGAVREVAELILAVQGQWHTVAERYFTP
jgi:3-deoxy-D-manno-octulosonate 8-phosphate phosphatase (KDO 8-P phosphatase)